MFLIFILAFLCGCLKDMKPATLGNSAAARRILIYSQDTDFKRRVIAEFLNKLGSTEWHYEINGLNQIGQHNLSSYNTVVILSPIKGAVIDERVEQFLNKQLPHPKIIVCYTYGFESLKDRIKWDYQVDAISSASRISSVPTVVDKLVEHIQLDWGAVNSGVPDNVSE